MALLPEHTSGWIVSDLTPSYLRLGRGEIERRAEEASKLLGPERCTVCPRLCKVDRLADEHGLCRVGRQAVVASYFAHFGEENCLRGSNGSGTIFFSGCNLRCVFCQNYDISWELRGERVSASRLAQMMLELQRRGCHNINFVTPEHVVPQIVEAIPLAMGLGLTLPIVYNTSSYDSLESLRMMEGIVDIYMPDFKVWGREAGHRFLRRPEYAEIARETVREMNRQVGPLVFDKSGLARRGLLVRHLVMPGMVGETESILEFIAKELGPDTYVDLMAQYYPAGLVGREGRDSYSEINRHVYQEEYGHAAETARALGLHRLDARSLRGGKRLMSHQA